MAHTSPQHCPSDPQLASTVCYHSVLQEMLAYAGRALELLVQGIQSQEEIVPEMALALFLQLCSRQEGSRNQTTRQLEQSVVPSKTV